MANVIEATLASRFVDGISKGIEHTKNLLQRDLSSMGSASNAMSLGISSAFDRTTSAINQWEARMRLASANSQSQFRAISFAAGAMSLAVAGGLLHLGRALMDATLDIVNEASEVTELKVAYESLIATTGRQADLFSRMRSSADAAISSKALLSNANRLLQSNVKITNDQYVQLVDNVSKLAKSAGSDGVAAQKALTDAVIKGNASGFQAIGVHLNVRDAVSNMAQAMGESRTQVASATRMQAFYNELLTETSAAAAQLPTQFLTLNDVVQKVNQSFRGWAMAMGEGVLRSGVFQAVVQRMIDSLSQLPKSQEQIDEIALATNRFFVSTLTGAAQIFDVLSAIVFPLETVWALIRSIVNGVLMLMMTFGLGLNAIIEAIVTMLAMIPGAIGKAFQPLRDYLQFETDRLQLLANAFGKDMVNAWRNLGSGSEGLSKLSQGSRNLAAEMSRLTGEIVRGTAGIQNQGGTAEQAAVSQKKLNDQVKAYRDLLQQMNSRGLDPSAAARQKFRDDMRRIRELDLSEFQAEQQREMRDKLRRAAIESFQRERMKINEEYAEKEMELWKRLDDFERSVQQQRLQRNEKDVQQRLGPPDDSYQRMQREAREDSLRTMDEVSRRLREQMMRQGNNEWLVPLAELHERLLELNKLDMTPFHQIIGAMKSSVADFGAQAGQAWASFWADIVSGQENSGKKLLAAFLGMIGQMLVKIGVLLMQTGLAEIILANTLIGRLMGASVAAGVAAMAIGAVLAAAGGVLQGASSVMAGTNNAGASATFQEGAARPVSGERVVISSGREGSQGQQQPSPRQEVLIRLAPGLVAEQTSQSMRRNNQQTRVALEQMAY